MPEIAVNGTVLHYEEAGTGEPLLLLHGGGGTALLHFRREIPALGTVGALAQARGRFGPPWGSVRLVLVCL